MCKVFPWWTWFTYLHLSCTSFPNMTLTFPKCFRHHPLAILPVKVFCAFHFMWFDKMEFLSLSWGRIPWQALLAHVPQVASFKFVTRLSPNLKKRDYPRGVCVKKRDSLSLSLSLSLSCNSFSPLFFSVLNAQYLGFPRTQLSIEVSSDLLHSNVKDLQWTTDTLSILQEGWVIFFKKYLSK